MKLSNLWSLGRENSLKASEITRQISLAGIALIWVLRNKDGSIDQMMLLSGLLLFLTLAFDLIQHIITVNKYRSSAKQFKSELVKKGIPSDQHGDQDYVLPADFHKQAGFFFWAKIVTVIVSYGIIVVLLGIKFLSS